MLKKTLLTLSLLIAIFMATSAIASAYQIDPTLRPTNEGFALKDEIKSQGAAGAAILVLQIIAGGMLYFAGPIAVIMIAFSAFTMVMSGTESEKLEQAKKHLTWSIIGLIAIIFSYSLVRIIIVFINQAAG